MTPPPKTSTRSGCVAGILQMLKLPDGTVKVLVEGTQRARINSIEDADSHFTCQVTPIEPDAMQGSETRGPAPRDRCPVRTVRKAQQEDPPGDPDLAGRHR